MKDMRTAGIRGADVRVLREGDDTVWLGASGGDDVQFRRDPANA